LPTDDLIREGYVQDQNADTITSGKKRGIFGKDLEDEGILLQPDFEFDEDGNIIEFDASHLSPRKRRKVSLDPGALEGPVDEEIQEGAVSLH
jgi:meiotic recombination protein REC8